MKKTNKMKKSARYELLRKALVVVLTYSMVAMQSPLGMVAYADEATDQTAEQAQAAEASTVSVALYLSNGYIATTDGQTMDARTSSLSLPAGKDFRFSAKANNGYDLSSVAYELGGSQTVLTPGTDGLYTLPASAVVAGVQIRLTTSQTATATSATTTPLANESTGSDQSSEQAAQATAEPSKTEYTYEDDDVKVTATLEQASAVPDDAQLVVTAVTADSKDADGNPTYDYDAYMKALNKKAGATDDAPVYTSDNTLLYDVAFIVDGKEVEPAAGTVKVKFAFKKNQLADIDAEKAADVTLVHLPLADSVTSTVDTTAKATDVSVDDIKVETPKDSTVADSLTAADVTLDDLSVVAATTAGKASDETDATNAADTTDGSQAASTSTDNGTDAEASTGTEDSSDVTTQEATAPEGADYVYNGKDNGFDSFTDSKTGVTYKASYSSYSNTWVIQRSSFPADVTEITVPAVLPDRTDPTVTHPVSVFDPEVYPSNKTITKVTIPDNPSLTSIELADMEALTDIEFGSTHVAQVLFSTSNALRFCESITELTVPAGVTNLGYGVLSYMDNLKAVKFEDDSLTEIGSHVFYNDPALTTVEIPNSVTAIDYGAFENCSSLTTVELPAGLTSLGRYAFSGTKVEQVDLPEGITSLEDAFRGCTTLKTVTIPANVTNVYSAFRGCTSLQSITFEEGSSLTKIDDYFAQGCTALTSVEGVPDSVTSIGNCAFSNDSNLMKFTGGAGVTSFGQGAFENNRKLPSLGSVDMSRVTSIGGSAFLDCHELWFSPDGTLDLSSLRELKTETRSTMYNGYSTNGGTWTFASCWYVKKLIIGEGVTTIPSHSFYNLYYLDTAQIPNSVTHIGELAFAWAGRPNHPTAFTIGSNDSSMLQQVDRWAFYNDRSAHTIKINASSDDVRADRLAFIASGDGSNDVTWTVAPVSTDNDRIADADDAPTLQQAIDSAAARDNKYADYIDYEMGTIAISKDIKLSETIKVPAGSPVKLVSKDGATIVASDGYASGEMFAVQEGADLTLGNGIAIKAQHDGGKPIVTATNATVTLAGATLSGMNNPTDSGSGAVVMKGGTLNITDGAIKGNSLSSKGGCSAVVLTNKAHMTMSGGEISDNTGSSSSAGGVRVGAGCNFEMSGGTISGNHGYRGGGVLLDGDNTSTGNFPNGTTATMTMTGGTIDSNYADVRGAYNNGGGGVYVYWNAQFTMSGGTISNNVAGNSASVGGGVATEALNASANRTSELSGGGFTMNGGTISGNSAVSGGGIYSFSQNTVAINAGRIENNTASNLGGGIYVSTEPYTVRLNNALITGNSASVSGGGVWICPEGQTISGDYGTTDGTTSALGGGNVAVYGNTSAQAGDDVSVLKYVSNKGMNGPYNIGNAVLGGGNATWYRDGHIMNGTWGYYNTYDAVQGDNASYRYGAENSTEVSQINTSKSAYALKAVVSDDAKALAEGAATVVITGNKAARGGGVSGNGTYIFPHTAGSTQVSVTKAWEGNLDAQGNPQKTGSVEVELVGTKNGSEHVLGTATLSDANSWTYQWNDLDDSYTYTVREKDVPEGYKSTVTRADGDADGTYTYTITNTYSPTGSIDLEGTKTLTGRDMAEGEFKFQVTETVNGETKVVSTGTNASAKDGKAGTIDFSSIDYTSAGEHDYTVSEVTSEKAGITSETQPYHIHVSVTDDGKGNLTATRTDNAGDLDFTNTYTAMGSVQFHGTKSMDGRDLASTDVYNFDISEDGKVIATGVNDGTTINYPKIEYTLKDIGTHKYTITERAVDAAGVKSDTHKYHVTVTVADKGDGTLSVKTSGDDPDKLDFTNTYRSSGSIQIRGTKQLTGRTFAEGDSFTFTLTGKDDAPMPDKDTVTVKPETGTEVAFAFDAIKYTQADAGKTYTYEVREKAGDEGGLTYDDTVKTVKVKVTDNKKGNLTAQIVDEDTDKVVFTNEYSAHGTYELKASKTLTGRPLQAGEFTFQVKEGDTVVAEATNDANGSIVFPAISYSEAGEHEYTVSEVAPTQGGVTAETKPYQIHVSVTDNGDGTLTAKRTDEVSDLDFSNSYTSTGSVQISGMKEITGRDFREGDSFSFKLEGLDGAPMPSNDTVTVTPTAGSEVGFTFDEITYTQADAGKTYTYQVTEVPGDEKGVGYDETVKTVQVSVTDDGQGNLRAVVTDDSDAVVFTNVYREAQIELTKHYFGSNPSAAFSFVLTETDADWQILTDDQGNMAVGEQQTNGAFDENGEAKVVFHETYGKETGTTHYYTLAEVGGTDATVYHVTVKLDDEGIPTVSYEAVSPDGTTAAADSVDFYNNETVKASSRMKRMSLLAAADEGVTAQPVLHKELTNGALTDGEFSFTITNTSGNDLGADGNAYTATAQNDASGKIAFPTRCYYQPGVYTYEIKENAADDDTVVYDSKTITATVTVTKDDDGSLKAEIAYSDDDSVADNDSTFTNTLRGVNVRVQKTSKTDRNEPLKDARYGLWLYNPDGNDVYLGNKTSGEDGWMTFEDVPTTPGAVYYFKEEHAPEGHLVNPYRDSYFSIVTENGQYKLVYEGQAEFDAATGMQTVGK